VTWSDNGDGRFYPTFKWKSIVFRGQAREYRAFNMGEREAVLRFFSNRIGDYLFGTPPILIGENKDGPLTIKANPAWDDLPSLTLDENDLPVMTDGSELLA
tara:strand:- start:7481 stop:7783 length:303 start_codon:yes stop_codon:yes gene_type:complete